MSRAPAERAPRTSRSMRKVTCSLTPGTDGFFGGSSAGLVVTALKAPSAASRDVVVLRGKRCSTRYGRLGRYVGHRPSCRARAHCAASRNNTGNLAMDAQASCSYDGLLVIGFGVREKSLVRKCSVNPRSSAEITKSRHFRVRVLRGYFPAAESTGSFV
jgi:hypothetical protein